MFQFPTEFKTGQLQNMTEKLSYLNCSLGATNLKVPTADSADDTDSLITTPAP
jgi:hypothetical protein